MGDDATNGSQWRNKFVNFVLGTVLAGFVTMSFSYKTWREQTRLDLAKQRLQEATTTFDQASHLMSARNFSFLDVVRHIGDNDDAFIKRREKLEAAIENWNLSYPDLLQRFQFALEVDGEGNTSRYPEINKGTFDEHLDCNKEFNETNFPPRADWNSPSWRLAALNYCFINDKAIATILELVKIKSASERYPKTVAVDNLVRVFDDDADRVRFPSKRAIQKLRQGAEIQSFWRFLTE